MLLFSEFVCKIWPLLLQMPGDGFMLCLSDWQALISQSSIISLQLVNIFSPVAVQPCCTLAGESKEEKSVFS